MTHLLILADFFCPATRPTTSLRAPSCKRSLRLTFTGMSCNTKHIDNYALPKPQLHRHRRGRQIDIFLWSKLDEHIVNFKAFTRDARLRQEWSPHYACPVCHFHVAAFNGTAQYAYHLYTHLPEEQQMFQCPEATCGYAPNLRKHVRRHHRTLHGPWTPEMNKSCENHAAFDRHRALLQL